MSTRKKTVTEKVGSSKQKATRGSSRGASATSADGTVESYLRDLKHPLKPTLVALRSLLRGVDPRIVEEIKWNSPSFKLDDHFATFNLRKNAALLVLHRGARTKPPATRLAIDDPSGILDWRGNDRAIVSIEDAASLAKKRAALRAILTQWIALLPPPTPPKSPQHA